MDVSRSAATIHTVTATPIDKPTNGRTFRIMVPCGGIAVRWS
jgi:hypothetical protein